MEVGSTSWQIYAGIVMLAIWGIPAALLGWFSWRFFIRPARRQGRLRRLTVYAVKVAPREDRNALGQLTSWHLVFPELITLHADFVAGVLTVDAPGAQWKAGKGSTWNGERSFKLPLHVDTYAFEATKVINHPGAWQIGTTVNADGVHVGALGERAKWDSGPGISALRTGSYDVTLKVTQDKQEALTPSSDQKVDVDITMTGLPHNVTEALKKCVVSLRQELIARKK